MIPPSSPLVRSQSESLCCVWFLSLARICACMFHTVWLPALSSRPSHGRAKGSPEPARPDGNAPRAERMQPARLRGTDEMHPCVSVTIGRSHSMR